MNPPIDDRTPEDIALRTAATRLNQINILWELTQAFLAVTLALAAVYISIRQNIPESEALKNALFVVLGFYFGRTNHTRPVRALIGEDREDIGGDRDDD